MAVQLRTPLPAPASVGISQDNIMFGLILLAFMIFITMKGKLSIYMGFFAPGGSSAPAPANTSSPTAAQTAAQGQQVGLPNAAINPPNQAGPQNAIANALQGATGGMLGGGGVHLGPSTGQSWWNYFFPGITSWFGGGSSQSSGSSGGIAPSQGGGSTPSGNAQTQANQTGATLPQTSQSYGVGWGGGGAM